MLQLVNLVLGVLVTFRLTSLLNQEDGPFEIFETIRRWAGLVPFASLSLEERKQALAGRPSHLSAPSHIATNEVAKAIECIWCLSIWVGLLVAVLFWATGNMSFSEIWIYALAFSAGAIQINK